MSTDTTNQSWVVIEHNVSPLLMTPVYDKAYGSDRWKIKDGKLHILESVVPVRVFPYEFPENKDFRDIEIVSSFSKQQLDAMCHSMNGKLPDEWQKISFKFGALEYFVAVRGMQLYQDPLASRSASKGSQAVYYGTRTTAKCTYLLQYLPPHSSTSRHYHEGVREFFHILEGAALIYIGGRMYTTESSNTVMVPPGLTHCVTTEDMPSLTLLVMDGQTSGFSCDDHHYSLNI